MKNIVSIQSSSVAELHSFVNRYLINEESVINGYLLTRWEKIPLSQIKEEDGFFFCVFHGENYV